jgi:hypothetical protein
MSLKNRCPAQRMFSKSLMKHFKSFRNGSAELHTKLGVDMLLDFAIHHRQNETQSQKSTHVKTMQFTAQCHVAG